MRMDCPALRVTTNMCGSFLGVPNLGF